MRDDSDDDGESVIHASSGSNNTSCSLLASSASSAADVSAFSYSCLIADSFCWNFSTVHTVLTSRSVLRTRMMDSNLLQLLPAESMFMYSWENFYHNNITESNKFLIHYTTLQSICDNLDEKQAINNQKFYVSESSDMSALFMHIK